MSEALRPAVNPWPAVWILGRREIVRFFRQRSRVIGAIATPLLFWVLFGAGFDRSFRITDAGGPGQSFREYYFPGSLMLIVLFTAIFTTISVIEDRREGFLQGVLVSPVARWAMVLGKVWGGAVIAVAQALFFLLLALTFQYRMDPLAFVQLTGLMFAAAVAMTSVGLAFAWRTESTQGFHSIMNLVLMPMWLLSGAFFPAPEIQAGDGLSRQAIHWAMRLNPLSYAVAGTRRLLFGELVWDGFWLPSLFWCWVITLLFAGVAFTAAVAVCGGRSAGDYSS